MVHVWLLRSPDNHLLTTISPESPPRLGRSWVVLLSEGMHLSHQLKASHSISRLKPVTLWKKKKKISATFIQDLFAWSWLNSCDFRWDLKSRWTGELDTISYELSSFFTTTGWSNSLITADEALICLFISCFNLPSYICELNTKIIELFCFRQRLIFNPEGAFHFWAKHGPKI